MPLPNLTIDDSVLADDLLRIIAACERFEADWNAGQPRRIEHEMAEAPQGIHRRLFRELLALELELARRDGGPVDLGAYVVRFADRADAVREVFSCETVTAPYPEVTEPAISENRSPLSAGYELLRELGAGGQATTYLARDRALQRLVVLKRYHGAASDGRREAVLNEGRALARIRSQFVAPCYGVEERGDEIDLVVEYVPGQALDDLAPEDRPDIGRWVRLVEQVATGLAEVHACGLLHRDIKPQNIILGDDGVPRLVDFGLAVPVASEALHQVSGSPPYMAPEQARGQGERVDARTDVFGLGAVLYFLLSGRPPHDGDTLRETLEQARDAPVIPARRVNRRVPRALDRVCMRALATDPQSRYSSADAMRQALRRYRLARQVTPMLAAVAAFLAVLVPAWVFWTASVSPPQKDGGSALAARLSAQPPAELKQASRAELRVTRFEIPYFAKVIEKSESGGPVTEKSRSGGLLGRESFSARFDDEVTIEAELSEPAYSYLIAFRPDGTNELCDPEDEDTPPATTQRPQYPPSTKGDERYRLSEGTGLYAFVLVVSRSPLPSYREWKKRVGAPPWAAGRPCEPQVVWRDAGHGLEPLLADQAVATRGKGVKAREPSEPAAKLATWLRGRPGVDAVTLEAFPVEP
jgi:tRNA A-37 threonylcarbamoyl transferase component Bud32